MARLVSPPASPSPQLDDMLPNTDPEPHRVLAKEKDPVPHRDLGGGGRQTTAAAARATSVIFTTSLSGSYIRGAPCTTRSKHMDAEEWYHTLGVGITWGFDYGRAPPVGRQGAVARLVSPPATPSQPVDKNSSKHRPPPSPRIFTQSARTMSLMALQPGPHHFPGCPHNKMSGI